MSKQRIIFIGGIGRPTEFGGELTKNKELVSQLKALGLNVLPIDSYKCHHDKIRLIRFAIKTTFALLFYHKATFIFSTAFWNFRPILLMMKILPFKYDIVYWIIGGVVPDKIETGEIPEKDLVTVRLFIVEGKKMMSKMKLLGFENVRHIPNFKTIGDLPLKKKFSDGKIHFVFLSRIIADKGCDYILESARELNNEGLSGNFAIDFWGPVDDDYKTSFSNKLETLKNVEYKGFLNLFTKGGYEQLAGYDMMLFPTYWKGEGFPGIFIDAYKCGLPVISSDWHFNDEVVKDGVTGILIPAHSQSALTDAMRSVIKGEVDIAQLSENCIKEVKKYDTPSLINQTLISKIIR